MEQGWLTMADLTVTAAQRGPASTGTKIMVAMIAFLAIALVVVIAMMWREAHRADVVEVTETAPRVDVHNTFTYTFNLAELVVERCGTTETKALAAASDAEKATNPGWYDDAIAQAAA